MKVELKIRQGSLETTVTLVGYRLWIKEILTAIEKIVNKKSDGTNIA